YDFCVRYGSDAVGLTTNGCVLTNLVRSVNHPNTHPDRLHMRIPAAVSLSSLLLTAVVFAQDYPPPYPRPNATRLVETDRIVVWDMAWPKDQPTPMHRHVHDQVGTYYQAGGRLITQPDGTKRTTFTNVGGISTTGKGTTHIE